MEGDHVLVLAQAGYGHGLDDQPRGAVGVKRRADHARAAAAAASARSTGASHTTTHDAPRLRRGAQHVRLVAAEHDRPARDLPPLAARQRDDQLAGELLGCAPSPKSWAVQAREQVEQRDARHRRVRGRSASRRPRCPTWSACRTGGRPPWRRAWTRCAAPRPASAPRRGAPSPPVRAPAACQSPGRAPACAPCAAAAAAQSRTCRAPAASGR